MKELNFPAVASLCTLHDSGMTINAEWAPVVRYRRERSSLICLIWSLWLPFSSFLSDIRTKRSEPWRAVRDCPELDGARPGQVSHEASRPVDVRVREALGLGDLGGREDPELAGVMRDSVYPEIEIDGVLSPGPGRE